MSVLITRLLAVWRKPVVWTLLGAFVAGAFAWEVRGLQSASLIGSARTAQARSEKELSDLRAMVANNVAEIERLRADEQTKALKATKAQTAKLLDLQARLVESERERVQVSTQLREELSHASASDARNLGPIVLRYLERVRAEQSAR